MASQAAASELSAAELANLRARARRLAGTDGEAQERAWLFYLLHDREHGALRLSRREWIEQHVWIEDKDFKLDRIQLNQSQRNLEALVLREERRSNPVRIVILKARQNGISTYDLAVCLWLLLAHRNKRLRVVADREDLCKLFLHRLRVMLRNLKQHDGVPWDLPLVHSNRDEIVLGEPWHSSLHVVSANTPSAGFGETAAFVGMEETSKWNEPYETAKGVLNTCPKRAGTYVIDVSQAKGNSGYFAEKFQRAWRRKHGLAETSLEPELAKALDVGSWQPIFFPWFIHQEYRWTNLGAGDKVLPEQVKDAIVRTLDDDEKVLLQQRYFLRGRGWMQVDCDQLAWRRHHIETECNGSLEAFHEQFPAFPEEAFLASGRPAFNSQHVARVRTHHEERPSFVGNLEAA